MNAFEMVELQLEYNHLVSALNALHTAKQPEIMIDILPETEELCETCGESHEDNNVLIRDDAFIEFLREPLAQFIKRRIGEIQSTFIEHGIKLEKGDRNKSSHLHVIQKPE